MDLRRISVVVCLGAIGGCSSTDSENVTTQGIAADIDVVADGSGTTVVSAQLEVGSGGIGRTGLELSAGDTLTATANGIQRPMTESSSVLGQFTYSANFGFDDGGTLFTVAFNRMNGISAPNSNVALPDGFLVQSPTSNDVYGVNDSIPIVWAPSGSSIVPSIDVALACTQTNGLRISTIETISLSSDSGSANLPVAAVIPIGTLDNSRLCDGTIYFQRWRRGNLDSNYGEGGQISAEQNEQGQFFVDLSR